MQSFFHGSPVRGLREILPASETGNIRPGEEERRGFQDVVFLTTDWDEALRYARGGSIYVVRAEAEPYAPLATQKNAKKAVNSTIHIASVVEIVSEYILEPKKRGCQQLYSLAVRE